MQAIGHAMVESELKLGLNSFQFNIILCSCFGSLPCYLSLMFVCFSVEENQKKEVSKGSTEFP